MNQYQFTFRLYQTHTAVINAETEEEAKRTLINQFLQQKQNYEFLDISDGELVDSIP